MMRSKEMSDEGEQTVIASHSSGCRNRVEPPAMAIGSDRGR